MRYRRTDTVIYKIQNNIDNKSYIGLTSKTVKKRIGEHICCNYLIGKALRKYGIGVFTISVIDSADSIPDLYDKEKYWIAFYNCKNPNGYNLTDGGDGKLGYIPSEETRRKWSVVRKGRKPWNTGLTKETDSRLGGWKLTEGHKEKIRKSLLGHKMSEAVKEALRIANTGCTRSFSKEHRENIGKARMGIVFTEEHKANLKLAHTGKRLSDTHRKHISEANLRRWEHYRLRNLNEQTCQHDHPVAQL